MAYYEQYTSWAGEEIESLRPFSCYLNQYEYDSRDPPPISESAADEGFETTETNHRRGLPSDDSHSLAPIRQTNSAFEDMAMFPLSSGQGATLQPKTTSQALPAKFLSEQHGIPPAANPPSEPWAPGAFQALQAQVNEAAAVQKSAELERSLNSALIDIARLKGQLIRQGKKEQLDTDMEDSDDFEGENNQEEAANLQISTANVLVGKCCNEGCYHCPLDMCTESRKQKRDMKYHILTHTRPQKCTHCTSSFPTARELHRHVLERHQEEVEGFYCTFSSCGRSKGNGKPFKRRDNARSHIRQVHFKEEVDDSAKNRSGLKRRKADCEPMKVNHTRKVDFR